MSQKPYLRILLFLLLGFIIYLIDITMNYDEESKDIYVSDQELDGLFSAWNSQTGRPPNEQEVISIINDFIEVLGIGVVPQYRQRGIAKELMNELIKFFDQSSYLKILLEVRESNVTAQNLYTNFGFNKISKRKNYYNNEDADIYLKERIYV